jgi:rhodanese-related sulfurtransferase
LNKQYLPYCAAFLLAFLIIAPSMVAACVSEDKYQNITVNDAKMMLENASVSGENMFLLDVRTPAEYNYSHIEGAKLIPLKNVPVHDPVNLSDDQLLPNRMKDLPEDKYTKIVVYCRSGKRGAIASQMIADAGYKRVYNMQDGITAWVNASYPVVVDSNSWANNYPKVTTK